MLAAAVTGGCAFRPSTNTNHRYARFTERHHYD